MTNDAEKIEVLVLFKGGSQRLVLDPDKLGIAVDAWSEALASRKGVIGGPDASGGVHMIQARLVRRIVCGKAQSALQEHYNKALAEKAGLTKPKLLK